MNLLVDFFFQSLAETAGSNGFGVVLSGAGADGTAGIKAIKEAEGIVFAQDPATCKFAGMPQSAIQSALVDLVGSPSIIARELGRIGLHPLLREFSAEAPSTATTRQRE